MRLVPEAESQHATHKSQSLAHFISDFINQNFVLICLHEFKKGQNGKKLSCKKSKSPASNMCMQVYSFLTIVVVLTFLAKFINLFALRLSSHEQFWHTILRYYYKDITIIWHFLAIGFYWPTKLSFYKKCNVPCIMFCEELTLDNRNPWLKIIFL